MQSSSPLKHFVFAFLIALAVYVVAYSAIEHRRTRNGPWEATFTNDAGASALVINERKLNISNVVLVFPGQPPPTANLQLRFDTPRQVPFDLPIGKCIFMDTTFQPGTLVLSNFGHEIQLLPRALTIDRREFAWQSGARIILTNAVKTPAQ